MPPFIRLFCRAFFAVKNETPQAFYRANGIKPKALGDFGVLCPVCHILEASGFALKEFVYYTLTWLRYSPAQHGVIVIATRRPIDIAEALKNTPLARFGVKEMQHDGATFGVIGLPADIDLPREISLARYWLGEDKWPS